MKMISYLKSTHSHTFANSINLTMIMQIELVALRLSERGRAGRFSGKKPDGHMALSEDQRSVSSTH